MRNFIIVVLVTLAGAARLDPQAGTSPGAECPAAGPAAVRITAQQLSEASPSYAFLVTNLAPAAITGIVIGRHDRVMSIRGVAPNVPVRMESPPGWEGRHVHVEETPYMVYLWENKDPSKRIMPQQSAAGFRITLPETKKDPVQVTFARIPFKASLADGSCRSGVVGVDTVPK
jgi:hypothetical protein